MRWPVGRLRLKWLNFIKDLGWNRLDHAVCVILRSRSVAAKSRTAASQPSRKSGRRKKKAPSFHLLMTLTIKSLNLFCFLNLLLKTMEDFSWSTKRFVYHSSSPGQY